MLATCFRGLAYEFDAFGVILPNSMRGVQAEDIHAGNEQAAQNVRRIGSGSEGGYDLRVRHPAIFAQTGNDAILLRLKIPFLEID